MRNNDKQRRLRFVREVEPQEPSWLRVALWLSWTTLAAVTTWVMVEIAIKVIGIGR